VDGDGSFTCPGLCCTPDVLVFAPDMVEFLTRPESPDPEREKIIDMLSYVDEYIDPADGLNFTRFSCKRFDGRGCTQYDDRPKMCSRYPDYERGGQCTLCSISVAASGVGDPWPATAETGIFYAELR
jgi:Fe-S-cluster containining protein